MTERVPFDVVAYERRVRAGGCFICGFLAANRAWTMSCSTTMGPMWRPLDGSMDGRWDGRTEWCHPTKSRRHYRHRRLVSLSINSPTAARQ